MVNYDKILQKLKIIQQNLSKLTTLKDVPEEVFINDFEKYDAAKYNLQTTIEAMIDICSHIISRNGYELPQTNAEVFRILCRTKVLNPEKEQTYIAMAKFRNRVVHLYDQVDNSEIYRIIQENLDDFEEFSSDIFRLLEERK